MIWIPRVVAFPFVVIGGACFWLAALIMDEDDFYG